MGYCFFIMPTSSLTELDEMWNSSPILQKVQGHSHVAMKGFVPSHGPTILTWETAALSQKRSKTMKRHEVPPDSFLGPSTRGLYKIQNVAVDLQCCSRPCKTPLPEEAPVCSHKNLDFINPLSFVFCVFSLTLNTSGLWPSLWSLQTSKLQQSSLTAGSSGNDNFLLLSFLFLFFFLFFLHFLKCYFYIDISL